MSPTFLGYVSSPKIFYENYLSIIKKLKELSQYLRYLDNEDLDNDPEVRESLNALNVDIEFSKSMLIKLKGSHSEFLGLDEDFSEYLEVNIIAVKNLLDEILNHLGRLRFKKMGVQLVQNRTLEQAETRTMVLQRVNKLVKHDSQVMTGTGTALVAAWVIVHSIKMFRRWLGLKI